MLPDAVQRTMDEVLALKLMPHQTQALAWMLDREGASTLGKQPSTEEQDHRRNLPVHPAFIQLAGLERSNLYWIPSDAGPRLCPKVYMHYGEDFMLTDTPQLVPADGWLKGSGILADEMGTGKTLDVLALAAAHRRPASDTVPY